MAATAVAHQEEQLPETGITTNPNSGRAPESPSILSKAFEVLHAFNTHERVMTLSELARAADLPKSTVHRLLGRLLELGAVEHHLAGYRLGLGLIEMGANTPAAHIRDIAMPWLAALHGWTGETVHFGVLRGTDVVYLEKLARQGGPILLTNVGARLPANCTALGKALLAYEDLDELCATLPSPLPALTRHSIRNVDQLIAELREIRAGGLSHEVGQANEGVSCVGVAVLVKGYAAAAISIAYRTDAPPARNVDHALREAAKQIAGVARRQIAEGRGGWFPKSP